MDFMAFPFLQIHIVQNLFPYRVAQRYGSAPEDGLPMCFFRDLYGNNAEFLMFFIGGAKVNIIFIFAVQSNIRDHEPKVLYLSPS